MIGKHYKAHKENVIDLFNNYINKRGDINDGIDIKYLESRVESLKKGKFMLAVAGEVKAGKSTFINALLGAEILPSDVLQSSSTIVEIFKSKTSFLKVKYADGKEESIYDDMETPDTDEARERLHEICKIHDDYRDIPTTLIDECIKKSDSELEVDGDFVKQLENRSGTHLQDKKSII
jgi:predicted GTPase